MIKRKRYVRSSKQCQYLASHYAALLVNEAWQKDFSLSGTTIRILTGHEASVHQRYQWNDITALLPAEDSSPLLSETVQHNAAFLSRTFELPKHAEKMLEFMIVLSSNDGLQHVTQQLSESDPMVLERMLCAHYNITQDDFNNILRTLTEFQLICASSTYHLGLLRLSGRLANTLTARKLAEPAELLSEVTVQSPAAQFTLKQFEHVDAQLLQRYLAAATKQQLTGINILLYGEPGTGKTELARTLAKSINRQLLEVRSVHVEEGRLLDDIGTGSPSRRRLGYMNMLQSLLKHSHSTILLVDECEGLFDDISTVYTKEAFVRLLESNAVPAIWITNHVELLEQSYVRRFKLVMELPVPDEHFYYRMNKPLLSPLDVSKEFMLELAGSEQVSPAVIANAAHIAKTLALQGEEAEALIDSVIASTQQASGKETFSTRYQGDIAFNPALFNLKGQDTNATLADIEFAVSEGLPVRVLLTGPPGTGKTAWPHYLAECMGLDVLHIKSSDVLSKYVGDSEQKLAVLFRSAQQSQQLILLDEVDSILSKRESANAVHEVQLVNELLSQLECCQVPVFAATNHLKALDSAVMRRFDFKLECDYLTQQQKELLYRQTLQLRKLTTDEQTTLATLAYLTPGDFAILARRMMFQPNQNHRANAVALLSAENNRKQVQRPIGFIR
ncbi:AAA family ATPase [Shewanella algae]|uniref:AAA family ATPase n=1 Tax=Shewanella algae TaxID=38313 RepID=UPI003B68610F